MSGLTSNLSTGSVLARYRERVLKTGLPHEDEIPLRKLGVPVEASEEQLQLWLHAELASAPVYNEPIAIDYEGNLDVPALEQAFNEILRRHEAWRTSFEWHDGKLLQLIAPELSVKLTLIDLRKISARRREEKALRMAAEDARQEFDLSKTPLFRILLLRLDESQYRLYLTLHHIIFDGTSLRTILLPELEALYSGYASGNAVHLPPLAVQYADYSAAQKSWSERVGAEAQLKFWEAQLSGNLPVLQLPLDYPRPSVRTFRGAAVKFQLPAETGVALKMAGQVSNATLYMTVLAAFHVLLYHYTEQPDQVLGTATSTRKHPATHKMLGLFLNTVVIRTRFSPEDSFSNLVSRVREITLGVLSNDGIPFSALVSRFDKSRTRGTSPLFQIMFSVDPPLPSLGKGWNYTEMDVETGFAKFDLHLQMEERDESLLGRFIYSTDLFRKETIRQMANDWTLLLSRIGADPHQTVAHLANDLPVEDDSSHATGFLSRKLRAMFAG
ncbi:MAG: condensation domain-containing protein [Bryobacteraceae bacterium]